MLCPKCGQENAADATVCVACGEALQADTAQEAEEVTPSEPTEPTPSERAPRPRRVLLYAGIAAVVILLAVVVCLLLLQPKSLYSLVPADSRGLIMIDVPRLWSATEETRQLSEVRTAMGDADRLFGLSLEKDVAPCIGEIGIVATEIGPREPKMAVLVRIRNWTQALRCAKRAQSKSGLKWSEDSYHGVSLMRGKSREQSYGPPETITTARLGAWFVVGVGDGVAEKVIDVAQGRAQSIQKDPAWSKALANLPAKPIALFGTDSQSLMFPGTLYGGPQVMSDLSKCMFVCALTEKPDELRLDMVNIPKSDRLRQVYKDLKSKTKGLSGKALSQLPDGTIAAMLFSNPGAYFDMAKQVFTESAEPSQRKYVDKSFQEMAPLEELLKRCTGEFGMAFTWKAGEGFGFTALGETESNGSSRQGARDIRSFVEHEIGQSVAESNGLFTLAMGEMRTGEFKVLPCWRTKDQWLAFSTHPDWLRGSTSKLSLSGEARGADSAMVADLSLLPSMLREVEATMPPSYTHPESRIPIDMLRDMDLEKANLVMWGSVDRDGASANSTFLLRGWNWRKGLKTIVQFASHYSRRVPVPEPFQPYPPGEPTPYAPTMP
jgi:hypothetical protein